MVRTLQALTVLALISAGAVFVLCAGQWLQGNSANKRIERNLGPPVLERFRQAASGGEKSGQQTHSALVQQAEAFALYLNPPEPPKDEETPAPKRRNFSVKIASTLPRIPLGLSSAILARLNEVDLVSE